MCLLNIGKSEGSEIIQLFGRGVRLRGKHLSLKRSSALDGEHPKYIRLLETLNIFAVRANYMSKFRESLEKEGVEIKGEIELPLAIRPNTDFLDKGLVVPRVPEDRNFVDEVDIMLEPDPKVRVRVDMSLKIQAFESGAEGIASAAVRTGRERPIPSASLELVDWEKAYIDLLEYKERKGLVNLTIRPDIPKKILATTEPSRLYTLIADEAVFNPSSFSATALLQEAVETILRKYVDRFYRVRQERWYTEHMTYKVLDDEDPNFQDYTIKIARSEGDLIDELQKLIEEGKRLYNQDLQELPSIYFDRHLYQPLLVEGDKIKSKPPGLKDSERKFVEDMRAYCQAEKDKSLSGKEVFLLRNLIRGNGIGFFDKRGFYPDFILWIKDVSTQRIVFIEPHGMLHAEAYQHDDKAQLHEFLPQLAEMIGRRSGVKNVILDSYIVSATPYEDLRVRYEDGSWDKKRFAEAHILFAECNEDYDYMQYIVCGECA